MKKEIIALRYQNICAIADEVVASNFDPKILQKFWCEVAMLEPFLDEEMKKRLVTLVREKFKIAD